METCSLVLLSKSVFTSTEAEPHEGFVAIRGNRIVAVGPASEAAAYTANAERVIDLGSRTVMPGLVDVHTFFTGWMIRSFGADLSAATTVQDAADLLAQQEVAAGDPLIGHNLPADLTTPEAQQAFDAVAPQVPCVAFTADGGSCLMNAAAHEAYGFTPDACYAEMIWKLMPYCLNHPDTRKRYHDYMALLNSRGVTSIKEMCFDDYYGFADTMAAMEDAGELTVRVSMMSQPVGRGADLEYGRAARERFQGDFVRFSGYNRMTDRGIGSTLGELIEPYKSDPTTTCAVPVEWDLIEAETRAVDAEGFRYSLHCQGDGAVRHTVALYDTLQKDEDGKLVNRHAITDLEFSNPADLDRFGAIGGICEIYPQIQSLDAKQDIVDMVDRQLGLERMRYYWNRRRMEDAGITVSCGTDLPLLLPSLGESVYSGVGGYFDDGEYINRENMLTCAEMLTAWTAGGAYNCYREDDLGTLEAGKLADIAVLAGDIFATDPKDARDMGVALTISDGRIVYEQLD